MHDHLEKAAPVLPITLSDKEEPKEAEKGLSDKEVMEYLEKHIKILPTDIYDQVVNILGESVFDLQKGEVLAYLKESAADILKSKKEGTK